jgi:hypothetical protein
MHWVVESTEYEIHADQSNRTYQRAAIAKLQDLVQDKNILYLPSLNSSTLHGSSRLIICNRVEVNEWRSDGVVLFRTASAPLFLCSHCEICEFRNKCASRAADEDNISRLEGISRTQIEEQHRKGIFTLHQYSHAFKSRKPPKRAKKLSRPRYFALQARAIRNNKVHIHGKAELPLTSISA